MKPAQPLQSYTDNKCVFDAQACTPGYEGRLLIDGEFYLYRACPSHFKEAVESTKVKEFTTTLTNAVKKELGLPV